MNENTAAAESRRYLGKPEVCARLGGVDPATLARKVRDGLFPAPVYIFGRARWTIDQLIAWEAENIHTTPPVRVRNLRHNKVAP